MDKVITHLKRSNPPERRPMFPFIPVLPRFKAVTCGMPRPALPSGPGDGTPRPGGFALVATVMMMLLLALLGAGLLSLSSVSLRSSQQESAAAETRANARLGLVMAIGHLQKLSGHDQRITATAGLLNEAAPGKRHWSGGWSTEDRDPAKPNQREFLAWLVSES